MYKLLAGMLGVNERCYALYQLLKPHARGHLHERPCG